MVEVLQWKRPPKLNWGNPCEYFYLSLGLCISRHGEGNLLFFGALRENQRKIVDKFERIKEWSPRNGWHIVKNGQLVGTPYLN